MVQTITQGMRTRTLRSDNLGRLVSETHPENGTTTYAWDDAGNLVLKTAYGEYGANNGTIRGIVNHRDRTKDRTFTYDAFYRLTAAETAGSHRGLQWTYDRYGNRLSQTASEGTGLHLECRACFSFVSRGGA